MFYTETSHAVIFKWMSGHHPLFPAMVTWHTWQKTWFP